MVVRAWTEDESHKGGSLLAVSASGLAPDGLQQAYRRMVFNVMAVNRDDHTKNFAFP
jgi:serine/threonine protein kinase HipA of HipAB toxin-antitoxin module